MAFLLHNSPGNNLFVFIRPLHNGPSTPSYWSRQTQALIWQRKECFMQSLRTSSIYLKETLGNLCLLGSHKPAHWSFPEIQRMNSYERILWSHTRGYYGLIREDTMISHERILWSHTRGYYGLTWEDTMVTYERILWSHTRGYYGLIREDTMVSHERILWSHMRGYYGLTWEYTMVYWWKILSALCRTAGSGSRRFRMSCKTLSHGIFLEISLSIDWFFSVIIDMNTSKASSMTYAICSIGEQKRYRKDTSWWPSLFAKGSLYESFSVYKIGSNKYIENENDSHINRWLSMAVSGDDKTEAPTWFDHELGGCLISLVVDRILISLYWSQGFLFVVGRMD